MKTTRMKFDELIKGISQEFTKAWNDWDIHKLKSHLATNVIIESPKIPLVYPDNTSCVLTGREEVVAYWSKLKLIMDNYRVVQISLTKEDREIKTVNKVMGRDITVFETFVVNEYGKIEFLKYEYK